MSGEDRQDDLTGEEGRTTPERAPVGTIVEAAPLVAGMVLAGRYEIREVIGRGGMGLVVRAHDRTLGAAVAIKILRAEYAGERQWAERLAREVRLARQIHHPHVCRVFDFEESDGRVFLVMELASGGTLRDEIASGATRARPLAARLADARAIADGLAAIHAACIIHRDLSPQNLLRMSDGRLVISDFGLAIDTSESATSVRGGTVAYMAPEVVRGDAVSFASDIWSLGVVLHEVVFGERPRWHAAGFEMLEPEAGRPLTREERAVLQTCRACTAVDVARRPESAEVGASMLEGRDLRRRSHLGTRTKWFLAAFAVAIAIPTALGIAHRSGDHESESPGPSPDGERLIVPTGEPEEWTAKSRVLAEVPDRIRCLVTLPDRRTVRFVWGKPPRAEDLDTETGRRVPSPVVPQSYVEGCPDLSPDGHRLLFEGRAADGHPYALVSGSPDGSDARAVVPTADPSVDSQPLWLPSGDSFAYDVDAKHVGIFSMNQERTTVLPEPTLADNISTWHWRSSDWTFVSAIDASETQVSGYLWPSLLKECQLRLQGLALSFTTRGTRTVFATWTGSSQWSAVIAVDLPARSARVVGSIKDQVVRRIAFVEGGLLLLSARWLGVLREKTADGLFRTVVASPRITTAARCGKGFMTTEEGPDGASVVRRDSKGRFLEKLTLGPWDVKPSCSRDGADWYYFSKSPQPRIVACGTWGCSELLKRQALVLAASPDGDRVAFIETGNQGFFVHWIARFDKVVHDLTVTENFCVPGWSSNRTLWVARERNNRNVWVEFDVESAKETGRTAPGNTNCSDGVADLKSPVDADLDFDVRQTSQLRVLR